MYNMLEDLELDKLWIAIMKSKDRNNIFGITPEWKNEGVVYIGTKDNVVAKAKVYITNRQKGDPFKRVEYDLFEEGLIPFF